MTALGSTNHGNTSAHVQHERWCRHFGIKPIFGCEIYVAPPNEKRKFHQTVMAQDEEGLRNLNAMVSESWRTLGTTSKSKFPTVHWDNLKAHANGLIVLSGCADSLLSCTLLGGKMYGDKRLTYSSRNYASARRIIQQYQDIFGERYSIECQKFPGLERTCALNPAFALLAEDTGAALTASSDAHYPFGTDNKMQTILHAAHRGSTVENTEAAWEYSILLTFPTSDKEITNQLVGTGLSKRQARQAVLNTAKIAESCTAELPKNRPIEYPISQADWEPWQ